MRRCYRGAALALGGVLMTSMTSLNSCSFGSLAVYAAEDALTEELETAFQEEVLTEEQDVETDIPEEKTEVLPEDSVEEEEEPIPEETDGEGAVLQEAAAPEEPVQEVSAEVSGSSFGLEEQEYQVLLKIVEAEAGGEDTVGRMLVANVIMNRVRSGRFPNTVTEVVYQRCSGRTQFSPVSDGRIDRVSISPETVEAVARAMNGEDASAGALYFRSVYSNSRWFDRTLHRVVEHGNHIFYTM